LVLAQQYGFPSVGRTDPSPALLAGLDPAHDKIDFVWAEIDPIPLGPRSAQHILGLSPAQFVGPAQPSPIIYYMICILYCVLYYLYLDIYIEKLINFFENYFKKICEFVVILLLYFDQYRFVFLYCKDTNPVLK